MALVPAWSEFRFEWLPLPCPVVMPTDQAIPPVNQPKGGLCVDECWSITSSTLMQQPWILQTVLLTVLIIVRTHSTELLSTAFIAALVACASAAYRLTGLPLPCYSRTTSTKLPLLQISTPAPVQSAGFCKPSTKQHLRASPAGLMRDNHRPTAPASTAVHMQCNPLHLSSIPP
jgi:hypothetical protein